MKTPVHLLLTLALVGCATTYSRGRKMAEQGQFEQASRYWMQALDEDEAAKGPRKGLEQYASSAVWVYVERAEEHEAEQRFIDAIASYGDALLLADELSEYGIDPGLDRQELGRSIADVQDELTEYRYQQGINAAEQQAFADAIGWFEQSREFHPDYKDTGERIGAAHRQAGHKALRDNRYVRALSEFASAIAWTDDDEARAWHDVTAVALGRHYLQQGACRSAWTLFDGVHATSNDPTLDESIAMAEDCARVEVVVLPIERMATQTMTEIDLAGMTTDAINEAIREGATPFLRLVDPDLAEDVPNRFGHRYGVRGRLSQLLYERPDADETTLSTTGTVLIACPVADGYTDYSAELCDSEVPLTATQTTERIMVGLVGSVRVSDPRTGELMTTQSVDARYEHASIGRTVFRAPSGPVPVGAQATESVYAVAEPMRRIPLDREPLPDDTAAVERAVAAFAGQAAEAVLAAVDVEPQPREPRRLQIPTPLTDAEQIEFQAAEPDTQGGEPTRVIIRGGQ